MNNKDDAEAAIRREIAEAKKWNRRKVKHDEQASSARTTS